MPMQWSRVLDVVLPVMTIKNTFIDLVDEEAEAAEEGRPTRARRRCASLPPQAKLPSEAAAAGDGDTGPTASRRSGGPSGRRSDAGGELDGDDGAGSSRRCTSPDLWSDPGLSDAGTDSSGSTRAAAVAGSRATLCLQDRIAAEKEGGRTPLRSGPAGGGGAPDGGGRTPLRPGSRMFAPQASPLPPAVRGVLEAARAGLARVPAVCGAKASGGAMGGAAEVTAEVLASAPVSDESLLTRAKTALLEAAGRSTLVCVLGYGRWPFQDLGEGRFGCTLVLVPAEKQQLMCFDTCQHGSCPRAGTCRWCHPGPTDLLRVVVHVRRVHAR